MLAFVAAKTSSYALDDDNDNEDDGDDLHKFLTDHVSQQVVMTWRTTRNKISSYILKTFVDVGT